MFRNRSQYLKVFFVALAVVLGVGGYNVYKYLEFEELKARAHSGNANAELKLGKRFYYGNGVKKDYKQSAKWIQRAADQGNADAQYHLGRLLRSGIGVEKNVKAAVGWHKKAASQGNDDAMLELSYTFFHGQGVPPDKIASFYWAEWASQYRNVEAFERLAFFYMIGSGVKQDYVKAQMYAMLMNRAKYGEWITDRNPGGLFNHNIWLGLFITKDQLEQARRMAQKWKPRPQK